MDSGISLNGIGNAYRTLFENPVLGIRISSVAEGGRIVEANAAYQRMLGYSEDDLYRRTIFDLTHPDDVAANRELYAEMTAGSRVSYQMDKRLLRRDGSSFWGRLTVHAFRDPDGRVTHHIGLVEDISEQRRIQQELLERTESLRAVLDSAIDGIVLIDGEGFIQSVNSAVQKLFGYPPEDLLGKNVNVLMPNPWREEHDAYLTRYRATGEKRIIGIGRQVEGRRRDGSIFPLDLAVSEVRYGNEVRYLGTLRDITERLRLEAEIRQSQKMEAIGRLAGGVAHDFNTLLGTIRGYSEMLLEALPEGERLRHPAYQIHRAALRGADLTRQLLLFSRRQELRAEAVDLGKLLAEVEVMLDRLLGEDIVLEKQVEAKLGRVQGDPGELHQVILNLVVNACDAMPSGGALTLVLRQIEAAEEISVEGGRLPPGGYVLLQVTDTGTGMEEGVRKRIFEPFFTTKEPGKGTGLGLSTVHAVVERSQGGIAVESRLGRGTTFRVYLPSSEPEGAGNGGVPGPVASPSFAKGPAPSASEAVGRSILLVEDDAMFRGLLQQVLESQGHRVLVAENPAAARALVAALETPLELLLSDMIMPGGTGADLAVELRERFPQMKIVLMSGYTDDSLSSRKVDGSIADAFLEKPFATRELLRLVRSLLV